MRNMRWLLVALVCLITSLPAGAEDLSRFFPENLMMMVRVKLQPFLGSGADGLDKLPDLAKSIGAMDQEIEKQLGCLPRRDLQTIGLWMTDEFNVNGRKVKPRHAVGFVQGTFNVEKTWTVLTDLVNKFRLRRPNTSLAIVEQGGRKVIGNRSVEGTFITPTLFALGRHETMGQLYARTAGGFAIAPELQKAMDESRVFMVFDFNRFMNAFRQCPACRIPGFVFEWLKPIQTVALFDRGGTINLHLGFDTEANASLMRRTVDVALANVDMLMAGMERDLDNRIGANPSILQLMGELRLRKISLAFNREALKNLKFDHQGKTLAMEFTVPEAFKTKLSTGSVLSMIGAAAIRIGPKLAHLRQIRRAMRHSRMGMERGPGARENQGQGDIRQELNRRACQANLRKIRRAVEQYNEAHKDAPLTSIKDADVKPQGVLGAEMKELFYPQPDCCYSSNGDLTKDGKVGCAVHGNE